MRIVNQGDWARDAIDLDFDTRKEYEMFRNELVHAEQHVAEIAHTNGQKIHLWFLIEGHKFIVHIPKENGNGNSE